MVIHYSLDLHLPHKMSSIRYVTRMPQARILTVTPSSSLIDKQVAIKVSGVEAHSHVTIRSVTEKKTERGTETFEGHAHYKADNNGVVSVPDQASLGGTYTGKESMGLFWSMIPSPSQRFGSRYIQRDATKPMKVSLSLYQGHLDIDTLQTMQPDAMATAERWYSGKDVERIEVYSGRLRGALFKPKGPGPFPGVIDMFGTAGGLIEFRAAMLAMHGFACYALPYFNYKDLPTYLWDIELEYFRDAVDWLCDQPYVKLGGIGIMGVSTGASIAINTASHFPEKVNAVVSINGSHAQPTFPMTLNGVPSSYVPFEHEYIKEARSEGVKDMYDCWKKMYELTEDDSAVFKVENAPNCQYLFITGKDERAWDSCYYAREAMKRLARHGCQNYQLLSYPDAGHLIEVPYAPVGIVAYSPALATVVDHGGTPLGNIRAMEDSWPKILRFLRTHCGHDNSKL